MDLESKQKRSLPGAEPGQILLTFPEDVPQGHSVCVASSRLGQKLEQHDRWFDALRTLAARLNRDQHYFITADGTTADRFVRRIARLFGIRCFRLLPIEEKMNVSLNENVAFYEFQPTTKGVGSAKLSTDQTLLQIASQAHLLSVTNNGNVHRAALQRLQREQNHETFLLIEPELTRSNVAESLIAAGAVAWWLYDSDSTSPKSTSIRTSTQASITPVKFLRPSEIDTNRFLLHWTRRRVGPWPDQTEEDFIDDLIFQSQRREHDTCHALARILATGRIMASHQLTRDRQPVVCFSNRSLTELPERTVFRQHLGRWDFLPFGIAIDRTKLNSLGARPVIYGDETVWENLPADDRPFFQPAKSKNGKIDWTDEQEWRLLGDLELSRLPRDAVVVFVETFFDAQRLQDLSRWPIIVLR